MVAQRHLGNSFAGPGLTLGTDSFMIGLSLAITGLVYTAFAYLIGIASLQLIQAFMELVENSRK